MLKKIPFRIIWRNKSQFFGIIILTFLAALAYVLFNLLVTEVNANYNDFIKRTNQEDFHFITTKPIDIDQIENRYRIQVEERLTLDYEFKNKTIRFF